MSPISRLCAIVLPLAAAACAGNGLALPQLNIQAESEVNAFRAASAAGGSNPATTDLSGLYTGIGTVGRNPGGACTAQEPVSNFHVSGNRIAYGQFNGTIQPNGGVEMEFGRTWVVGQFNGPHFSGQYIMPACTYNITMDRVPRGGTY